jgi:hypothetical protein
VRLRGRVVGPAPAVHAPVSGWVGAAVRLQIVGHRTLFFNSGYVSELFDEAAGGWLGDHLILEVDGGRRVRVPLGSTRWRDPRGMGDPAPLEPPLPREILDLVAEADVHKGQLGFVERTIQVGETLELRAIVEAPRAALPSYREASSDPEALVARPDLGRCVLEPIETRR